MTMTRPEITVRPATDKESGRFSFIPHTGRADAFLFGEFGRIGDRDLTDRDADEIIAAALDRGFIVLNRLTE